MGGEIQLCEPQRDPSEGEIVLCEPDQERGPTEVMLCAPPCPGPEPFRVVEIDGDYYLAGGMEPYFFLDGGEWVHQPAGNPLPGSSGCPQPFYYKDSCEAQVEYTPSTTWTELTLSGTETPSVGSTYGASGGKPPYRYSISCGTIDEETGEVQSLSGCCGIGQVQVFDACESTAVLDVLFPDGQWVLIYEDTASPFYSGDCCSNSANYGDVTETRGKYRYIDRWVEITQIGGCGTVCEPTCHNTPNTTDPEWYPKTCVQLQKIYEWQCP